MKTIFNVSFRCYKRERRHILVKGKIAPEGFEDLVFVTRNNRPTQQFLMQECMLLTIKHIQKTNPATRAIENGMQPKTLQKILGHASLQMTMDLYCHVTEDTLFDAMKLMEKKCV